MTVTVEGGFVGTDFLYGLNFETGASLVQGSVWCRGQGGIWGVYVVQLKGSVVADFRWGW